VNIENENTQPATRESMPEYLDRLASDQYLPPANPEIEAGLTSAASEIRRLENRVTYLQSAADISDQKLGNLSEAILAVINEELEARIEQIVKDRISDALDDYDPTDHLEFNDAVDRRIVDSCIEDTVRDVLDNASVSISV